MRNATAAVLFCAALGGIMPADGLAAPAAAGKAESTSAGVMVRLVRQIKLNLRETWARWSRPPSRAEALRPLQRMIDSGRISGADLDRVSLLYPELRRPSPRAGLDAAGLSAPHLKPLRRMLESGRISAGELAGIEQVIRPPHLRR